MRFQGTTPRAEFRNAIGITSTRRLTQLDLAYRTPTAILAHVAELPEG